MCALFVFKLITGSSIVSDETDVLNEDIFIQTVLGVYERVAMSEKIGTFEVIFKDPPAAENTDVNRNTRKCSP